MFLSYFYNSSSDRIKFLIETRNVNGKAYYYYNYLVYADVLDNDNRSGAFFGIALRFDEYYTDYISIYRILDWAFNYSVVGTLLTNNGNKLKYAVPTFSAADAQIRSLEKTIIERLSQTLAPTRFTKLPIGQKTENAKNLNIPEATDRQVADALQKSYKVNLSPYYPSVATANVAKQFESKIEQLNQALNHSRQESEALKKQNQSLNNNLNIAKLDVQTANQKAQALQQEIKRLRDSSNLKASIETIKNPITQLADYFGKQTTPGGGTPGHTHSGRKPKQPVISFRGLVNLLYQIITLILLFCIFCLLTFCNGSKKDDTTIEEITTEITNEPQSKSKQTENTQPKDSTHTDSISK